MTTLSDWISVVLVELDLRDQCLSQWLIRSAPLRDYQKQQLPTFYKFSFVFIPELEEVLLELYICAIDDVQAIYEDQSET